ncbi:hypothetical protein OG738_37755 [Amycolatopsis sp. NBC_01488]|uniref:hypothetical protein n=1 Tax=Amycolatopsis sp. NBC_01488 TaxID=2903563 RepID=UPI002E2C0BB4|nr:hypothetical protein [Amycolatopsis sp. NBC_01488]
MQVEREIEKGKEADKKAPDVAALAVQGDRDHADDQGRKHYEDALGICGDHPSGEAAECQVTYDDADRALSTTDATGRTTSESWNVKDQELT